MAGASRVDLGPHLRRLPKPVTSGAQAAPPRLGRMNTERPRQICLPGQTHVAEGPHDQTGMYVMHHAFRRDLDRFQAAVRATPVDERDTWRALAARWERFAEVLHHHHTVEDEHIWPRHASAASRSAASRPSPGARGAARHGRRARPRRPGARGLRARVRRHGRATLGRPAQRPRRARDGDAHHAARPPPPRGDRGAAAAAAHPDRRGLRRHRERRPARVPGPRRAVPGAVGRRRPARRRRPPGSSARPGRRTACCSGSAVPATPAPSGAPSPTPDPTHPERNSDDHRHHHTRGHHDRAVGPPPARRSRWAPCSSSTWSAVCGPRCPA